MPRATFDPVLSIEYSDGVYGVTVRQPTVMQYRNDVMPHIQLIEDSAEDRSIDQLIDGIMAVLNAVVLDIDCVPSLDELTMGEALAIYRSVSSFITGGTSAPGNEPLSSSPSSSESPPQEQPISQPT